MMTFILASSGIVAVACLDKLAEVTGYGESMGGVAKVVIAGVVIAVGVYLFISNPMIGWL